MKDKVGGRTVAYHVGESRRVRVPRSGRVVLQCGCGQRLVVSGAMTVRRSGRALECSCGERFTLSGGVAVREPVVANRRWEIRSLEEKRSYSWLISFLEWLDGKEAREEYYARLERVASR